VTGNPAVGRQANGLLDAFIIGSDHAMYLKREATSAGVGTWNGFENLGGFVISDPVVTADNFGPFNDHLGQINVFVVGSDHTVHHISQLGADTDGWASEPLGGSVIGNPATGRFYSSTSTDPSTEVFELFVVGSDKALYYNQNHTFFH